MSTYGDTAIIGSTRDDVTHVPRPKPTVLNGIATIEGPKGHRTFKIKTQKENSTFMPGRRILSILRGQENTDDRNYQGFAFVNDTDIQVWRKKTARYCMESKATKWEIFADMVGVLVGGMPSKYGKTYDGYTVHFERYCLRCNKLLTTPESIERGIGPICADKGGF